jgi:crotonobetainyl-CoA hydratase
MTDSVLVERREHVLVITLNRPEAMNAINAEVAGGVGQALEEADGDPAVRAIVLTGAGGRAFSAGADLKAAGRGESIMPPGHPEWGFAGYVTHVVGPPTIAAVEGFALGGGTELVLASDLAVAGRSARFGVPEVKRGLIAGAGGAIRLPAQLPRKVAMELLVTGEPIDAQTACRWGFVNRVVDDGAALDAALELASVICANAPLSVRASKRIALGASNGSIPAEQVGWELNRDEVARISASGDAREGALAFVEKRAPRWTGA